MAGLLSDNYDYGGLLGRLSQTWPARLAKDAYGAVTLPGDVYRGKVSMYGEDGHTNPEVINRSADLAGLVTLGSRNIASHSNFNPFSSAGKDTALASRQASIYNPPVKSPRPFEADYPAGVMPNDAGKRLSVDMEGRPLVADEGRIAGRRTVGGSEEAVSPSEFNAIAEEATGRRTKDVTQSELRGDVGRTILRPITRQPEEIFLSKNLTPEKRDLVYGHELGHVIDQIAGEIPVNGILKEELKPLYNTLNNPNRNGAEAANWGKTFRPDDSGYRSKDIPREYMAEAVRSYISNPNYLKTVAPKTAARIREFVNSHPTLSKIIQFNAMAATTSPLAALMYGADQRNNNQ